MLEGFFVVLGGFGFGFVKRQLGFLNILIPLHQVSRGRKSRSKNAVNIKPEIYNIFTYILLKRKKMDDIYRKVKINSHMH